MIDLKPGDNVTLIGMRIDQFDPLSPPMTGVISRIGMDAMGGSLYVINLDDPQATPTGTMLARRGEIQ